jgi:hypothetical protein
MVRPFASCSSISVCLRVTWEGLSETVWARLRRQPLHLKLTSPRNLANLGAIFNDLCPYSIDSIQHISGLPHGA